MVVLPEGVQRHLPVGPDAMDVRLAVWLPVGEVQRAQLVGQPGSEILVHVDRCTGAEAADDESEAFGHRQLDEALVLAAHALEARGRRHTDEVPLDVVHPGMEGAGEAPRLARTVHHAHPAVPAHVGHGADDAVAVPRQQDGGSAEVDGPERPGPRQGAGEAEQEWGVGEERGELALQVFAGRVGGSRHLHDVFGHVGRPVLDVVEQATHQAVLERFPVHRDPLGPTGPSCPPDGSLPPAPRARLTAHRRAPRIQQSERPHST